MTGKEAIRKLDRAMRLPEAKKLLRPDWRAENEKSGIHSTGFCYNACEACFYMIGGLESGYKPRMARYTESGKVCTHWWLENEDGHRLDPTATQYGDDEPPYHLGKGCGFLTGYRRISNRSEALRRLAERGPARETR